MLDSSRPIVGLRSIVRSRRSHVSGSHCWSAPEKLVSMYKSLMVATEKFDSRSCPRCDQMTDLVPSRSCDMMCSRARCDLRQGVWRLNSTPVVEPVRVLGDQKWAESRGLADAPRQRSLFMLLPSHGGSYPT